LEVPKSCYYEDQEQLDLGSILNIQYQ